MAIFWSYECAGQFVAIFFVDHWNDYNDDDDDWSKERWSDFGAFIYSPFAYIWMNTNKTAWTLTRIRKLTIQRKVIVKIFFSVYLCIFLLLKHKLQTIVSILITILYRRLTMFIHVALPSRMMQKKKKKKKKKNFMLHYYLEIIESFYCLKRWQCLRALSSVLAYMFVSLLFWTEKKNEQKIAKTLIIVDLNSSHCHTNRINGKKSTKIEIWDIQRT